MGKLWEGILRPAMFALDAEWAHDAGIAALGLGAGELFSPRQSVRDEMLASERFGLKFANPIGVAAGFDKNGKVVQPLAKLGFGFVEVGTVTFEPQAGNPKPRIFRLPNDEALINRLGFNNDGASAIASRLAKIKRNCVIGVNIGKNMGVPNEEAIRNFGAAFEAVYAVADYVAINVSSPNTRGLRELQEERYLSDLLAYIQNRNSVMGTVRNWLNGDGEPGIGKPILVKIAPDVNKMELRSIVDTCVRSEVAGIIATNTTVDRTGLKTDVTDDLTNGGLSGRPLARRSNEIISAIYDQTEGKLPIVGVGGIFNAKDAFEKIAAGASLIQAYTGFVYGGPSFASDLNAGLADILRTRGFSTLDDAVGSAVR